MQGTLHSWKKELQEQQQREEDPPHIPTYKTKPHHIHKGFISKVSFWVGNKEGCVKGTVWDTKEEAEQEVALEALEIVKYFPHYT